MTRNRYYQGPPSDHFDGERFSNPGLPPAGNLSLGAVLKWRLSGSAARWPRSVPVDTARPDARVAGIRVTMVGHASLLVQAAGVNILTDPVWSPRVSPFRHIGPKRVTAPGIAFDDLPPIDAVVLSHGHYDHLDIDTLRRLHARDAPLMAMPLGNDTIVRQGVAGARCVAGDWWARIALAEGVTSTLTPACHWSNRWPGDARMMLWAGHWLDSPAGSVWFVGDTGYGDGRIFAQVRDRLGAPDVALIPIGAYEPRALMTAQHVDPAEAVRIFRDVGAARALGIHWGTFQLTDEPREAPRDDLAHALAADGIPAQRFVAAEVGHAYDLAPPPGTPPGTL